MSLDMVKMDVSISDKMYENVSMEVICLIELNTFICSLSTTNTPKSNYLLINQCHKHLSSKHSSHHYHYGYYHSLDGRDDKPYGVELILHFCDA